MIFLYVAHFSLTVLGCSQESSVLKILGFLPGGGGFTPYAYGGLNGDVQPEMGTCLGSSYGKGVPFSEKGM